jgi:hypothetical protein
MVPSSRIRRTLGAALALAFVAAAARADTVTGVCPDGSIFIVKREADIPCRDARRIDPQDTPPIKPQFLPRPYAWDRFQRQQDPNNPYNLVEAARRMREAREAGAPLDPGAAPQPPAPPLATPQAGTPPVGTAPPPVPQRTALLRPAPAPSPRFELELDERQIRDLYLIVELAQQRAPATFAPEAERAVRLRVAPSQAFAARLREILRQRGSGRAGPVLLFAAVAEREADFFGHLTFVQGQVAYQPDRDDPDQLGILDGQLGALSPSQRVLGYVVLPESIDPAQPVDVYWNDRRLTATFRP